MNKNELAVQMVKDLNITKVDALKGIEAFIEVVSEELRKKEDAKVTLVGFGTFKTITKKRKKGRNPRTGAEIIIPRKRVIKFIPGKRLKLLCGGPHGPVNGLLPEPRDPVGSGQGSHGHGPGNGPKG